MRSYLGNIHKTSLLGRMHKVFVPVAALFYLFLGIIAYVLYSEQLTTSLKNEWGEKATSALSQLPAEVIQIDRHIDLAIEREQYLSFANLNRDNQGTFRALYHHLTRLLEVTSTNVSSEMTLLIVDQQGNVIEHSQNIRSSLVSVLLAEAKLNLNETATRFHKIVVVDEHLLIVTATHVSDRFILFMIQPFSAFDELLTDLREAFGEHFSYQLGFSDNAHTKTKLDSTSAYPLGPYIPHPHPEWFASDYFENNTAYESLRLSSGVGLSLTDPLLSFSLEIDEGYLAPVLDQLAAKIAAGAFLATLFSVLFFHILVSRYVVTPLNRYSRQVGDKTRADDPSSIEIEELRDAYIAMRKDLRTLLEVDDLTGIGSRKFFFSELKRLVVDQQGSVPGYLVYLDIDHFTWINDHHGHDCADRFLIDFSVKVSALIEGYIDHSAHVSFSRLAVDQFGLYISQTRGFSQSLQLIHAIQDMFNPSYRFEGHDLSVSVSIGVVEIDHYSQSLGIETLQSHGEKALAAAKEREGNHYQFYNVDIDHQVKKCEAIERELISALIHDSFKLMFMPIVAAKGRRTRGYEILLRCPSLEQMNFTTEEYVTQAEKLGLIEEIDLWVLRNSFSIISKFHAASHKELIFSINISALELANERFSSQVATLLEQYNVDTSCIELEVTETAFVPNDQKGLETLNALKDLGFRLVLDDFGAGYTSFHQLVHYPFDVLKIDKSFVEILNEQTRDEQSMVEVIYSLAKTHNLKLVAEGVETEFQADYLTELGCEWLQGYYFSKPVSEELMRFEVLRRPHLELVVKDAL
ncbi:putative bifunctional diguanylate cyclase/phosphodiesterase [Vibrio agarivorans]|uniref:Bifunctional diguanylate cyclase/phosphodiesterase n=1 Tax=Vibrio agarivorans TaxID=153622 RepID=A0ABT7Y6X6_9VIBR|nr:bifunctional diguanylate cyclase/phosphodiesterase [Vibrio agarivorans]MDN2483752.1 bifunctional diguanylate cyclase/phosphodiesterase [Vibrio agarivorans]